MRNSYRHLMKNLPLEKCPPDLSLKVNQKLGIADSPSQLNRAVKPDYLARGFYGLAGLAAVLLITAVLTYDYAGTNSHHQRLASNATALSAQISSNMKTVFLSKEDFLR
ncbi:MAG: hypothetical protein ACM3QW_06215 [Ignavibacteriales bacterium]